MLDPQRCIVNLTLKTWGAKNLMNLRSDLYIKNIDSK